MARICAWCDTHLTGTTETTQSNRSPATHILCGRCAGDLDRALGKNHLHARASGERRTRVARRQAA